MKMDKRQGQTLCNVSYGLFITVGMLWPLLRSGKRRKISLLRTAESLGASALIVEAIKHVVPSRRPDSLEQNSFPSGHTMNTVALATVAGALYRQQAPWWWAGAALISMSRLALRRHRIRDVVVGSLLGYTLARMELCRRRGFFSVKRKSEKSSSNEGREEVNQEMAQKREELEPQPGDKCYIRRDEEGTFTDDQVDISKSLSADVKQPARKKVKKGQGDMGDLAC